MNQEYFTTTHQQKQILLCRNLILLFMVGSFLITMSNYFFLGFNVRTFVGLGAFPFLGLLLWVNKRGHYQIAALSLSIIVPSLIFWLNLVSKFSLMPAVPYFEYLTPRVLIISVLAIPALIFDIHRDKFYIYTSILINIAYLVFFDSLHFYFGVPFLLEEAYLPNYHYFLTILYISWLVLVIAFLILKQINFRYETELNLANQNLINKQIEIQNQNEALKQQANLIKNTNQELTKKEQETHEINLNLAQEVEKKTQAFREINKELDVFLYRSSHDLRRPLTTLMGLAEVAKAQPDPQLALELLEKVNETAVQMDKMLTKLRMVSDMNSSEQEFAKIKLRKIIQHLIKYFQPEIKLRKIEVRLEYDLNIEVYSSDTLLNAVFFNLLENAILFSRKKAAHIHIKVYTKKNYLYIHFLDNGQGIEEKYLSQIFDMYFRANEQSKGNGLGLYVVRKSLEKLNGKISVKSTYDTQTEFMVEIPLLESPQKLAQEPVL